MLIYNNVKVYNLKEAIRSSGLPKNDYWFEEDKEKAMNRAVTLASAKLGSGHGNFLSGILVTFDVKYPQYWTPQFQRYHFAQIISSQAKMHRLCAKQSDEEFKKRFNKYVDENIIKMVKFYIDEYNEWCNNNKNDENYKEGLYIRFMKALSNLPMGYEMWMSISTNYLQLKTIYQQRKNHRLKEDWGNFCKMIEELPYASVLITK